MHNFSAQPVPQSHHPHSKEFLLYIISKSTLSLEPFLLSCQYAHPHSQPLSNTVSLYTSTKHTDYLYLAK